jgi:ferredoxin
MEKRLIVHIDEDKCDGCGQCIPGCDEGALAIVDGKAKLVADVYCDGLGACLGECPQGALTLIEREAEPFDEAAVEERLKAQKEQKMGCGCPSAQVQALTPCQQADLPAQAPEGEESRLGHWPVKLRLVPPEASFLKGADLLLAADCTAVALPGFHQRLAGKAVLTGCPKFDDAEFSVQRLAAILREAGPSSLTVLEMEVPCCSGLGRIAGEAIRRSGRDVRAQRLIVGRRGAIQEEAGGCC